MRSVFSTTLNQGFAFQRSLIGKKFIVAVTGFVGAVYVLAHMLGNLQVFLGPQTLNAYAVLLKSNHELLWGARLILLAAVTAHIVASYQLARISHRARRIRYELWRPAGSTYASRTMRWSGPVVGVFIVYHLLHLTTGTLHPDFRPGDVYHNVITGFHVWYVTLFYVFAMAALGLHLYHGTWSMFQSSGLDHPKYNRWMRKTATVLTTITILGFVLIPIAVLLGFLR
jgi:succinate dehydrogenase / fumarate reductase cytochrome b subunit